MTCKPGPLDDLVTVLPAGQHLHLTPRTADKDNIYLINDDLHDRPWNATRSKPA